MSPLVRKRISNLQVGLCGHPACRIGAATCVQRDRNLELIVKSIDYGLMECLEGIRTPCKLLKRWSGRPDSNRRRPAWEAGILPLNYSRVPLFSATSLSGKDLAAFAASLYRPCNPSRTMGSDRKMDSKTDSKPAQ